MFPAKCRLQRFTKVKATATHVVWCLFPVHSHFNSLTPVATYSSLQTLRFYLVGLPLQKCYLMLVVVCSMHCLMLVVVCSMHCLMLVVVCSMHCLMLVVVCSMHCLMFVVVCSMHSLMFVVVCSMRDCQVRLAGCYCYCEASAARPSWTPAQRDCLLGSSVFGTALVVAW